MSSFYWGKHCSSYSHFPACVCVCVQGKTKNIKICARFVIAPSSSLVCWQILAPAQRSGPRPDQVHTHTQNKTHKKITMRSPFKLQKPWCQTFEGNEEFLSSGSKEQEERKKQKRKKKSSVICQTVKWNFFLLFLLPLCSWITKHQNPGNKKPTRRQGNYSFRS